MSSAPSLRRAAYYTLLATFVADAVASKAETLMHLTLWSWFLHILYFELPLTIPTTPQQSSLIRFFHGPSFCGSHALFSMYLFTLFVNPKMEFDLAPPGRPDWLVLARACVLHVTPVLFHWMDWYYHADTLQRSYLGYENSKLLQFWACLGGYFAMGLTWEQVNGDVTGTYNIESMSAETFTNLSKTIGISACIASFYGFLKPKLFSP